MKDLRDYLSLYLLCDVQFELDKSTPYIFIGIADGGINIKSKKENSSSSFCKLNYKLIKPLLYTVEYAISEGIIKSNKKTKQPSQIVCTPEDFKAILFEDIDLFGLIEAGLALDKTKL